MNEEEKKAVKFFYNLRATIDESNMLFDEEINVKHGKETIKQITIILNLIEKLQKENELAKQALIKNCNIADERNQLLKENEKLKTKLLDTFEGQKVIEEETTQYIKENYIPKQKIKDIIDRIDYDIEKTKEIISKNTSVYATYRKNDYQIVRLRAMNTKSLDIKKRLKKLLESEK